MTTVATTLNVNGTVTVTALTGTPPAHDPGDLVLAPDFSGTPFTDSQVNVINGDFFGLAGYFRGGADSLVGGSGFIANALYGDAPHMSGHATGGNDTLAGGAGTADRMWGDAQFHDTGTTGGKDVFAFATAGIHGLGALNVSHPGAGTLIDFGSGNSILVASLVATDFLVAGTPATRQQPRPPLAPHRLRPPAPGKSNQSEDRP